MGQKTFTKYVKHKKVLTKKTPTSEIYLKKELPDIIGVDGFTYILNKPGIIKMPTKNATALVNSGGAIDTNLPEKPFYRIYIGDSQVMPLKDESIDCIITSPPYYTMKGVGEFKSYKEYKYFLSVISKELLRVLKTGDICAINIDTYKGYAIPHHLCNIFEKNGFIFEDCIAWVKEGGFGMATPRNIGWLKDPRPMNIKFHRRWEQILIFSKGGIMSHKRRSDKNNKKKMMKYGTNVWEIASGAGNKDGHPAAYPDLIPKMLMNFYSYEGDIILDPFLGRGTTMYVAKENNRSCIGCEIDSQWIPDIKKNVKWNEKLIDGRKVEYDIIEIR